MTAPVMLDLDEAMLTAIDAYASRMNRPRSELVREALTNWLELQAWQRSEIERGLAEADAGTFATDEDVAAVFGKYGIASRGDR